MDALRRVFIGDSAAGRAAAMLSTGAAGASFMPGLMPRRVRDQVLATGVMSALQYGRGRDVAITPAVLRFRSSIDGLVRRRWAAITGAQLGVAVTQFAILYVALRGLGCRRSRVAAGLHRWAVGALAFGHPGEDLPHRILGVDGRRPLQRLAGTSRVEERR